MTERLRQFVVTRGRARDESDLPLETPISRSPTPPVRNLTYDEVAIVALCDTPQTIVDLSSNLNMAVGVLRVLTLDLVDAGALVLGGQASAAVAPHRDVGLLSEVLDGIRHL